MLDRLVYFATTFLEASLSVFGLRTFYEQPAYSVRQTLPHQVEIRDYGPRVAVETAMDGAGREQAARAAFQRLFAYITGANSAHRTVAMTAPVVMGPVVVGPVEGPGEQRNGRLIAMTIPVQSGPVQPGPVQAGAAGAGGDSARMRFFLPRLVVRQGPPAPTDPLVHIANLPAATVAALRFSGAWDGPATAARSRELLSVLAASTWHAQGAPVLLTYDPPFTIPALRRNEVAVQVRPDLRRGD